MNVLQLDNEQTIYQAAATHAQLSAALQGDAELVVDLSAIEECDTAFIQLLLWLQLSCRERHHALQLRAPSASLLRLTSQLGLDDRLQYTPAE
ncbi:STAS domain-containing protein [Chitinilyticum aquatile]|uniref:STAS domain-containing protein n=1 Tax=Chitinilyticum aquatile TaxID=362520 RepID=UPI000401CBBC|nr:STAS domain-containing protein [Chitinilyticum aquatile]